MCFSPIIFVFFDGYLCYLFESQTCLACSSALVTEAL